MVSPGQPYLKTRAIVLQVDPITNTSARVEWLSDKLGRFTSRIQGAYRPKSFFLGQFDTFYTCELVLQRSRSGYFAVRECYPLEKRVPLRSQWRSAVAASYFTSLIHHWLPYQAHAPEAFHLLSRLLDTAASSPGSRSMIFWGELKWLEAAGWKPNLIKQANHYSFDLSSGQYNARKSHHTKHMDRITVSPDAAALLNRFQQAEHYHALHTVKLKVSQEDSMERLLGGFLQYQLEIPLPARSIALNSLGKKFSAV